ncbi:citrate lyase subunit alpha [Methylobacterium sp. WL30]|uniref:citrate lyase subunit alpha n=1 Tax=unclassified Methylobacterium TaxID=2615210 RepID=UPI0011CBA09A|nr:MULTISPECIES: citrate lyase subunit alpha [unclassified Methylobacterium]TXN41824.1 citrate lyase subunit alpha [Methylobacterium sp. WL93]TXN51863.1 citrate lyase subunit alpha [Methylobacterium sp. WL119]TXN68874.1 citrate lyase subunit alpha [Methylobacterium sp. WL30]
MSVRMGHWPADIPGYGPVRPFAGAFADRGRVTRAGLTVHPARPEGKKLLPDLDAAIRACGLRDGATISFHHHLRNGDAVLNQVLDAVARAGLRGITVAASALFAVHAPLIEHIRAGVVTGLAASTIYGPLALAVSQRILTKPVLMYTHGGRARAVESGDLRIDVAFVAAPVADSYGNLNGTHGRAACGPLGYAVTDAQGAERVVAVTDTLVPYPAVPIEIGQDWVDFVVPIASIGDPSLIVSGTTRATTDPVALGIAETAASVIAASGLLTDGFSFQTGAGGASLAAAAYLGTIMAERGVAGSFAAGGITAGIVRMFDAGLFRALMDVQAFDIDAVDSFRRSPAHQSMSASMYANPHNRGCVVNRIDASILGAAEIDRTFNVNVTTGTDGIILGGSGGHADTAAGASLTLITTQLVARSHAKVVDHVTTVTTPGETVDVVVTDGGVTVNPRRLELADRLRAAGIPLVGIDDLAAEARRRAGAPARPRAADGRIVAVVEYRDGTVIDMVPAV